MQRNEFPRGGILSGADLKMIAVFTMTIDHVAAGLLYQKILKNPTAVPEFMSREEIRKLYKIMRDIGRIAFPIYCFLLVEGFLYTHSRAKYCIRLFLFALISEIPFNLGLYGSVRYPSHNNVFFELGAGLCAVWIWDTLDRMRYGDYKGPAVLQRTSEIFRRFPLAAVLLQAASAVGIAYLAYILKFDYRYKGIALILLLYLLRFDRHVQALGGALFMSIWELPAVISFFPLIFMYNGKRGFQLKYFFYLYYPLHLIVIYLLSRML